MTADEFKNAQDSLKYSTADVVAALRTPYRTILDYRAGKSRIPGAVEVALELLQQRDRWVMDKLDRRREERINRDFPHGIPSEVEREEG